MADTSITARQFIYSIKKLNVYSDLSQYLSLNFYFLDHNLNSLKVSPIDFKSKVDTSYKSAIRYNEISFKFNIPDNVLYFIARTQYGKSTTFNILDIKGKVFTDRIRSKEKQYEPELKNYGDLTYEKYLLNKKGTNLSSVEQQYGPTGYLLKVNYEKK